MILCYVYVFLMLLVAFEHFYFLVLEMFLWTSPKVMKIFGVKSKELAQDTRGLAANLGLYNGFLAAGVLGSLFSKSTAASVFCLICVVIAAVVGAYSTKKIRIFYVQAIPALLGLIVLYFRYGIS